LEFVIFRLRFIGGYRVKGRRRDAKCAEKERWRS
jgi:hypothetical protein